MMKVKEKKIRFKWNKKKYVVFICVEDSTGLDLKRLIEEKISVPVSRQKVFGVGDDQLSDTVELKSVKIKKVLTVFGTAEVLSHNTEQIKFSEDFVGTDVVLEDFPCGLKNMGNTCYMNSVLQVLFNIPEFTKLITTIDSNGGLLYELGVTYKAINDLRNKEYTPLMLVTLFRSRFKRFNEFEKTDYGNMYRQQDAMEFLNVMFHQVLREPFINIFKGKFDVEFENVVDKGDKFMVAEEYTSIPCHIKKDTTHLLFGLMQSFEAQVERSGKVYSKNNRFATLSNYIVCNYVRFFFKKTKGVKSKIVKKIKYDMVLDIFKFCNEDLKMKIMKRRKLVEAELYPQDKDKKVDFNEDEKKIIQTQYPTGFYELFGIVTHQGRSVDSGHYVSWVKVKSGKWVKYNDEKVQEVTEDEVLELAGGLSDHHIAYIAFYRKRDLQGNEILHKALQKKGLKK